VAQFFEALRYKPKGRSFDWHDPSGHTMTLGSTQSLTEMSKRDISWDKGGRCLGLAAFICRLSWNLGALASWNHQDSFTSTICRRRGTVLQATVQSRWDTPTYASTGILFKRLCGTFLSNFLSTFHIRNFSPFENVSLEQVTWYFGAWSLHKYATYFTRNRGVFITTNNGNWKVLER
jgi:hypothetical protein